jgi:hypothetical protein
MLNNEHITAISALFQNKVIDLRQSTKSHESCVGVPV